MPELRRARWAALLTLAVLLLSPVCVRAGSDALRPGEYITEMGWGILTISTSGGRTTFSIAASSANGSCSLDGEIRKLRARVMIDTEDNICVVTFRPTADGIKVSSVSDCGRHFCGAGAELQLEYLRLHPGCGTRERSATRDRFKQLYDAKSYAGAAALLEPLLSHCPRTLTFREDAWIRNDLAITQYHLGRLADCRKTLEPLVELASTTEEELRATSRPSDFDTYFSILKAARHNAKLCARASGDRVSFDDRVP